MFSTRATFCPFNDAFTVLHLQILDISFCLIQKFLLSDIGFHGGKSKSLYCREGHLGITLVKFASDQSGLKEALRLTEHFLRDNRGRNGWSRVQPSTSVKEEENNPDLVKVDQRTGEKKRVFYGYLATVSDMDKVDFETRKKVSIESIREFQSS